MHPMRNKHAARKPGIPAACLTGTGLALILTAGLCLPLSAVIAHGALSPDRAGLCALIAAGLGVFLAAVAACRLRGGQSLAVAAGTAGGVLVVCALVCLCAHGVFGGWFLRLAAVLAAAAMLGALVSVRQNPHKKFRV